MPVFRNRTVLEVAKVIKAFLNLEVGLTCGAMPEPTKRTSVVPEQDGTPVPSGVQARELEQTRRRLEERARDRQVKGGLASSER